MQDEYERILYEEIDKLEDELMNVEMKLQDTLTGSTGEFFEKVKGIIELMKSTTQNFVTEVANEMNNFYSELKKYATAEQEKFETEYTSLQEKSEMYQEIKDDDELLELMLDKDNLVQHLDTSKENVG